MSEPSVTYEWDVHKEPLPILAQMGYGRRIQIRPYTVKIHASTWRDVGELWIVVEGRTVRRDGSLGETRRSVVFDDSTPEDDPRHISAMPEWLRPIVADARRRESLNRSSGGV